jgi:hypothetical protein
MYTRVQNYCLQKFVLRMMPMHGCLQSNNMSKHYLMYQLTTVLKFASELRTCARAIASASTRALVTDNVAPKRMAARQSNKAATILVCSRLLSMCTPMLACWQTAHACRGKISIRMMVVHAIQRLQNIVKQVNKKRERGMEHDRRSNRAVQRLVWKCIEMTTHVLPGPNNLFWRLSCTWIVVGMYF